MDRHRPDSFHVRDAFQQPWSFATTNNALPATLPPSHPAMPSSQQVFAPTTSTETVAPSLSAQRVENIPPSQPAPVFHPLGTREEVQQDDYVSPVATMYLRAWNRYREAEDARNAYRMQAILNDARRMGVGDPADMSHLFGTGPSTSDSVHQQLEADMAEVALNSKLIICHCGHPSTPRSQMLNLAPSPLFRC
jgi:hypothetical protein